MSVKMINMVFERFPLPANEMVLALAIADHAHDDGTHIYPGNEKLAIKTRMSERTVIRLLKRFVTIGWLIKTKNSNSGRGYANEYRISPAWISGQDLTFTPNKKSDNLSPLIDNGMGDKNDGRVTPEVNKGDTVMSHQQSLTIKPTINTVRAQETGDQPKRHPTPEGAMACRLIQIGVGVTSMHPTLLSWVADDIHIDLIEQCVAVARQYKPAPIVIAPNYLDRIVRDALKPKLDNSWLATDEGVIAKGGEVGCLPKIGESMQDYRTRLKAFVVGGGQRAA